MNYNFHDESTVAILISNGFKEVSFTDQHKRLIQLGARVNVV